ncbi:MAG: glycosyltransferase [Gaiellales bacterium]
METLAVTIVMPVRNEASGIAVLLDDLRAQTHPPIAIHVVDTGSDDDTAVIVARVAAADSRVKLLRSPRSFPGAGRNVGVREAGTPWVAFVDGGMRIGTTWLAELVAAQRDIADVVLGSYEPSLDDDSARAAALAYVPMRRLDPHGGSWRGFCLPSSLFRRQLVLDAGGFPEALRSAEDLVFWNHVLERRPLVAYAERAVVTWSHAHSTAAVWRRFRTYALHSFAAGEMSTWFDVMARRYLLMGVVSGPLLPVTAAASWGARALVSMWRKPEFLPAEIEKWPTLWLQTAARLGTIDAATWRAWVDWRARGAESP